MTGFAGPQGKLVATVFLPNFGFWTLGALSLTYCLLADSPATANLQIEDLQIGPDRVNVQIVNLLVGPARANLQIEDLQIDDLHVRSVPHEL